VPCSITDVTNAEFICGKAEDVLPSLMWRLSGQEVIMVVDPPRAGLRPFHFISSLVLYLFTLFCLLAITIISYIKLNISTFDYSDAFKWARGMVFVLLQLFESHW